MTPHDTPCIRSAYWVGAPKPGQAQAFAEMINETTVPLMRKMPGVRQVRALWPQLREDAPPDIACQVVVEFDSHAERDRMKASPERAAMRPHVQRLIAMFDGQLSHVEFDTK